MVGLARLRQRRWVVALTIPVALLGLTLLMLVVVDRLAPVDLVPRPGSQVVTTDNDQLLRAFADAEGVWRYPVTLAEVSPYYLEALTGYEDRFFYRHPGVNPFALMRAAGLALWHGEVVSGGSTLTMQVARLRYPEPRTLTGKLKEMVRALQLDWHYNKAEILTYYLNHAPFGGTLEGVQAASLSYLGYPAQDLTRAQAALLAVLPQAPSRYRPDRHPQRAEAARNKLMQRLADQGIWSPETAALCDQPQDAWVLDGTFPATWMHSRDASLSFNRPVTSLNLSPESGLQIPLGCDLPTTRTQVALWPAPIQGWLKPDWRSQQRLPGVDPRCPPQLVPVARQPLALKGASDGTRLMVDPGQEIELALWAEGGQPPFHWYLNGEQLPTREPELELALAPLHRYQIVLVDQSGQSDRIQIQTRVR